MSRFDSTWRPGIAACLFVSAGLHAAALVAAEVVMNMGPTSSRVAPKRLITRGQPIRVWLTEPDERTESADEEETDRAPAVDPIAERNAPESAESVGMPETDVAERNQTVKPAPTPSETVVSDPSPMTPIVPRESMEQLMADCWKTFAESIDRLRTAAESTLEEVRSIEFTAPRAKEPTPAASDPQSTPQPPMKSATRDEQPVSAEEMKSASAPRADAGEREAAHVIETSRPEYPRRSIRLGEQGSVIIAVEVLASGRAGQVSLHTSSGYRRLDEAALEAARRSRFAPERIDGVAVDSTVLVPFEFRLE